MNPITRAFTFLSTLLFFNLVSYGQAERSAKLDSLKHELNSANDTARHAALQSLIREYRYNNYDSAFYFAKEALALAEKMRYKRGIADSKLSIGGLYADRGKAFEGIQSTTEALIIYKKLYQSASGEEKKRLYRKTGSAYGIIGHNWITQGNYPEGLKNSFLALKIVEELNDSDGMSTYHWNIGNIYVTQHNYEEALKHYNICLEIAINSGDKSVIATTYGAIGFVYLQQGNFNEATEYYSKALKLAEEGKDAFSTAEIYLNLGDINGKQGKYKDAIKYDQAAINIYKEIGMNQQLALAYIQLGNVNMSLKKYADATENFSKGLQMAGEVSNLEYLKMGYESLSALDSSQGNYKKSLEHYKLSIGFRDSLLNEGNTKKLVQQQMQYDYDKKDLAAKSEQLKKDVLKEKELQKQKLMRNGFVGGFIAMLVFAGIFFNQRNKISKSKKRSDELLLNILPMEVAEELKEKGSADAKQFDEVTVMFTDFKNFTQIAETLSPTQLVTEIHNCFKAFDEITGRFNIEKIKTIGDSYMCAGGLPVANKSHPVDVVNAALEMQRFMQSYSMGEGKKGFEIRIGIHTGPVVAGIVGVKKFAYDIWGDTVNIASRMESSGEAGKVNISGSTYELIKDNFRCEPRGKIEAKNMGGIAMYFVDRSFSEG